MSSARDRGAVEHLRGVALALQMAPIAHEVNIAMEPYLGIVRNGRTLNDYEYLVQSPRGHVRPLVWLGRGVESGAAADGR
jgi:hypothetical protein